MSLTAVRAGVAEISLFRQKSVKLMDRNYSTLQKRCKSMHHQTAFTGRAQKFDNSAKPQSRSSGNPDRPRAKQSSQYYEYSELYGQTNSDVYNFENKYDYLLRDYDEAFVNRDGSYSSGRDNNGNSSSNTGRLSRSTRSTSAVTGRNSTIVTLSSRLASGVGTVRSSAGSNSRSTRRNTVIDEDEEYIARRNGSRRFVESDPDSEISGGSDSDSDNNNSSGDDSSDSSSDGMDVSSDEMGSGRWSKKEASKFKHRSNSHRSKSRSRKSKMRKKNGWRGNSENKLSRSEDFSGKALVEVKKERKPRYVPWSKLPCVGEIDNTNSRNEYIPVGIKVNREWLMEVNAPPPAHYTGSLQYCPQVGDRVFPTRTHD